MFSNKQLQRRWHADKKAMQRIAIAKAYSKLMDKKPIFTCIANDVVDGLKHVKIIPCGFHTTLHAYDGGSEPNYSSEMYLSAKQMEVVLRYNNFFPTNKGNWLKHL